jgi:hypothetical protein
MQRHFDKTCSRSRYIHLTGQARCIRNTNRQTLDCSVRGLAAPFRPARQPHNTNACMNHCGMLNVPQECMNRSAEAGLMRLASAAQSLACGARSATLAARRRSVCRSADSFQALAPLCERPAAHTASLAELSMAVQRCGAINAHAHHRDTNAPSGEELQVRMPTRV